MIVALLCLLLGLVVGTVVGAALAVWAWPDRKRVVAEIERRVDERAGAFKQIGVAEDSLGGTVPVYAGPVGDYYPASTTRIFTPR